MKWVKTMVHTKILVVEDESIIAKDIQNRLKSWGYAVPAIASSGEEAIKKAAGIQPDLVLMDIVLKGGMDGVEAAEEIRNRFNIPVVYLSAYADDKKLQRARITEPFGYILKPFEDRELRATIEMALYKHKMEMELKESKEWLDATLKSIGDAVIATDTKGYVTFMNPVAEALTGWKQEDAVGKDLTEVFSIIDEGTRNPTENPATKALQKGVIICLADHPTVLIAKDGKEIPIDDSAAPIRDDKGDITGAVLVFRDITERKWAEEVIRKQLRELKRLEEMKNEFLSVVSHELRTPLTPIQGYIDLLQGGEYGELNYEQKGALDTCMESSRRLKSMIDNLVEITRLESRKVGVSAGRVNLTKLVDQVLKEFKPKVDEKNIRISYKRNIPSSVVRGDKEKLRAVIDNLVSNAIKFTPDGGRVLIGLKEGKRSMHFSVKDSGVGIPEEHQGRIFDKFYQVDTSTSREFSGMGLGLAICKEIIDLHGGRIWVKSKPGEGSEFHFNIPSR